MMKGARYRVPAHCQRALRDASPKFRSNSARNPVFVTVCDRIDHFVVQYRIANKKPDQDKNAHARVCTPADCSAQRLPGPPYGGLHCLWHAQLTVSCRPVMGAPAGEQEPPIEAERKVLLPRDADKARSASLCRWVKRNKESSLAFPDVSYSCAYAPGVCESSFVSMLDPVLRSRSRHRNHVC